MTLAEIAEALRHLYPDAVGVELFVNEDEHSIELRYKDKSGPKYGGSYKRLDGKWAHKD